MWKKSKNQWLYICILACHVSRNDPLGIQNQYERMSTRSQAIVVDFPFQKLPSFLRSVVGQGQLE
jgi:hypothetical protein